LNDDKDNFWDCPFFIFGKVVGVSPARGIEKHPAYLYYMDEFKKTDYDKLVMVTLSVVAWVNVFSEKNYIDIVLDGLRFCQKEVGLDIYGYVIMTNHMRLLTTQRQGQLSKVLGRFKSYTAKQILKLIEEDSTEKRQDWLLHLFRFHAKYKSGYDEYHFWQEDNDPITCFTYQEATEKLNYIHHSPVQASYVTQSEHWFYSSAHPKSPLKVLDLAR